MHSTLTRSLMFFWMIGLCLLPTMRGGAQQSAPSANSKTRNEITLFIRPTGPSTAFVGLSYCKLVPHNQVQNDIKKLLAVSGWKLNGSPTFSDKSARPDDPKRFPPTTGAEFSLDFAPQFHDNAPVLAPYLQAFQAWNRLEILFVTSDMQPYNGVTDFRNPALDVALAKSDGIYSYLVTIREHAKALPPLIPDTPSSSGENAGKAPTAAAAAPGTHPPVVGNGQTSSSSFWPYLFIITGALLTGGVTLYLLAKRHQENLKPGRLR